MAKIVYVDTEDGDWCGLYVDGELFEEGHEIPRQIWIQLLESLGHETETWDGTEYAEKTGGLPKSLDELSE